MNKIKQGLISLLVSGPLFFSGCSQITIGGQKPCEMDSSSYSKTIEKTADKLSKSQKYEDRVGAMKAYGSLGRLDKMDKQVKWLIENNLEMGMIYSETAEKYRKMHEKN